MRHRPVEDWSRNDLLRLVHDGRIQIDDNRQDNIKHLRELVKTKFISVGEMNDEDINMNIRKVHEQCQKKAEFLSKIIGSFIRKRLRLRKKLQKYSEIIEVNIELQTGQDRTLNELLNELQTQDCSIMFIGDTGAGKSTIINTMVQKAIVPTGVKKTTGAVLELRCNELARFSTLATNEGSEYIEQQVEFDRFPNRPLDALKSFLANSSRQWSFVRGRIEYPLLLLRSGIAIRDTPGLNDTEELTRAVTQDMLSSQAFICVLERGLTDASRQILVQLIQAQREPESVFFVITHMDDYSSAENTEVVQKLRIELQQIDSRFYHSECIILNPRIAFNIFDKYNLYTIDYSNFMCRVTPFLNRVLSFKNDSISERLGDILKQLRELMETIRFTAQLNITECINYEAESHKRRKYFSKDQDRLKLKCGDVIKRFLREATDRIITQLQTSEFNAHFQKAIIDIPFKEDIENQIILTRTSNTEIITTHLDLIKTYLQNEFEECAAIVLQPLLDKLATSAIHDLSEMFVNDFSLPANERKLFLEQLQAGSQTTMLRYHRLILTNIFSRFPIKFKHFIKDFLSNYLIGTPVIVSSIVSVFNDREVRSLCERDRWQDFRYKLAQQFSTRLVSVTELKSTEASPIFPKNLEECVEDIMHFIKETYVGTEQYMNENTHRFEQATRLMQLYSRYQDAVIPSLRAKLNTLLASRPDRWSLSANMLNFTSDVDEISNDDIVHVRKAELKLPSTQITEAVHVRRLSKDFCALYICNQTRSVDEPTHPTILRCYGAYRDDRDVFLVTEPWRHSLKKQSADIKAFSFRHRLQIAIELIELCLQMGPQIPVDQLTPETLVITHDGRIKVSIISLKPPSSLNTQSDNNDMAICHALGTTLMLLFAQNLDNPSVFQSLRLLDKQCHKEVENKQHPSMSIHQILYDLKVEQIKLNQAYSPSNRLLHTRRKGVGLLSIDGGGARGIIPAKILQYLEIVIGRPLWEAFHFCAGVSTGGLLVMSTLVRRTPPRELVPMYRNLCQKIFMPRFTPLSEYSSTKLEDELKEHFDKTRMQRLCNKAPHVFVVTKRNYEAEPYLLRNYDVPVSVGTFKGESNWLCSEAARATTAAHTFFSPFMRDNIQYTDGAMGFDNPSLLLFKEVLLLLPTINGDGDDEDDVPHAIDYIVSIGTGKMNGWEAPIGAPKTGIARIIETVQLGIEWITDFENAHNQMQMLAKAHGNIPYFRFNPKLPTRLPLDMRTETELDMLIKLTEDYLNDQEERTPEKMQQLAGLVHGR